MAKAAGLEPVDWEFESLHPHHATVRKQAKRRSLDLRALQVRFLPVAPDPESWVSGLNHLTANEERREAPGVRISHSPPSLEEVLHGGALVLKTSQCQRSWHKRVRLLSLPPFASAAVKVWQRSVKPTLRKE